jgi:hypothetical protein
VNFACGGLRLSFLFSSACADTKMETANRTHKAQNIPTDAFLFLMAKSITPLPQ